MAPLSSEGSVTTPTKYQSRKGRLKNKHRRISHSKSLPPSLSLTKDEEMKVVRSMLKKKRSLMPLASHALRASRISQRTLQDLDLDPSLDEECPVDQDLVKLLQRKQSLSIDERIALKKEQERDGGLELSSSSRREKDKQNRKERKCSSPNSESIDFMPLSYSLDEASAVIRAYDKKLEAMGRLPSQVLCQEAEEVRSDHDQQASTNVKSKPARGRNIDSSGPRRRSMSAPHPHIVNRKVFNVPSNAGPATAKDRNEDPALDRSFKHLHGKLMSYEDKIQAKLNSNNGMHRRRSVSAPRPGAIYVKDPPPSKKEVKITPASVDSALHSFDQRLKRKMEGSPRSLPVRAVSRSISDKTFGHNNAKGRRMSRNETKMSKSINAGASRTWQCHKCTFINTCFAPTSGTSTNCKMCFEPEVKPCPKPPCYEKHPSTKSLPLRAVARSVSDKTFGLNNTKGRRMLRNEMKMSKSINAGASRNWQCQKCTFINSSFAPSGGTSNCKMCFEPEATLDKEGSTNVVNASKSVNSLNYNESHQNTTASCNRMNKWQCQKCTYLNINVDLKRCKMCLEPVKDGIKVENDVDWNDLGSVIDETIRLSLRD